MFFKLIYMFGSKLRNDKIFNSYKFLKDTEEWSIKKLKKYQYEKCRELLELAYHKSSFYRKKFDYLGVKPSDFNTLDDLGKFPILTKQELLRNQNQIQIKKDFKKLFYSETSGSTGNPLTFYRNKEWDARHRAAIYRGYSWYDVNPWDKNGYFWGYNIDNKEKFKVKILDFLQNRFRIFSYNEKEIINFMGKLSSADYLEGYSSMIYETAKIINKRNIDINNKLKMIKGTSEKIYDKYQEEVKKAFGKKMVSEYGAAEAGIIAFECRYGNMHITMENVIVEEEDGEIIVTNLVSDSFPIIRYKLGDYIKLNKDIKCECGMEHYVIEDVLGRVGKLIYGKKDTYPSLTLYYIFKNLAINNNIILNYQVVQEEKGSLIFNIEQELNDKRLLENEIKKYFNNDVDYIINCSIDIKSKDKKQKDFISYIDE